MIRRELIPIGLSETANYYYGEDIPSTSPIKSLCIALNGLGYTFDRNLPNEIGKGTKTGEQLALQIVARNLLCEKGIRFPHTAEFYEGVVSIGLSMRQRNHWGMYKSEGLMAKIGKEIGVSVPNLQRLVRGLRVNGVLLALQNNTLQHALMNARNEFVQDYESMPPSVIKNEDLIRRVGFSTVRTMYRKFNGRSFVNRSIGAFLPYELAYWKKMLKYVGDRPLPLTSALLQSYAEGFNSSTVCNRMHKQTGIPLDEPVISTTMALIASDMPYAIFK